MIAAMRQTISASDAGAKPEQAISPVPEPPKSGTPPSVRGAALAVRVRRPRRHRAFLLSVPVACCFEREPDTVKPQQVEGSLIRQPALQSFLSEYEKLAAAARIILIRSLGSFRPLGSFGERFVPFKRSDEHVEP